MQVEQKNKKNVERDKQRMGLRRLGEKSVIQKYNCPAAALIPWIVFYSLKL